MARVLADLSSMLVMRRIGKDLSKIQQCHPTGDFLRISRCISEMVQDRDIVVVELVYLCCIEWRYLQ